MAGDEPGSRVIATKADDGRLISDLERLLREPGCPVCSFTEESARSFFSWFQIESFTAAEMQARLRAAMGMCPAHSRRLVDEPRDGNAEGHIINTVMRHAVAGARQTLRDGGTPGPCPACEAVAFGTQRGRNVLLEGLTDRRHARLYAEHDGICLPHFLAAAEAADRATLSPLAERLLASLEDQDRHEGLVGLIAGYDPDASRRNDRRERLPDSATDDSTVERLRHQLKLQSCSVCLARGEADRRYVHWFVERSHAREPSLETDPGQLCATHLHDVATLDEASATVAAQRQRSKRLGQLQRMLGHLARETPPARARRGRRGADEARGDALRELATTDYCPACQARDGVEQAQLALVNASLALREVRDTYEHSHGLCVRHALQQADTRIANIVHRHADGRLSVLSWEIEETARKYAWAYRHETSGPESDAAMRAMAQIDGRVFEGAPVR